MGDSKKPICVALMVYMLLVLLIRYMFKYVYLSVKFKLPVAEAKILKTKDIKDSY